MAWGGAPAPPWATAAAAAGPGGRGEGIDWGGLIRILYKAPEVFKTTQSPDSLHKAPTDYTKLLTDYTRHSIY